MPDDDFYPEVYESYYGGGGDMPLAGRINLATNPGLEVGALTGWASGFVTNYTLALTSTAPISGSYSAVATRTSSSPNTTVCSVSLSPDQGGRVEVTAGSPFSWGIDVKTEMGARQVFTYILSYDAGGALLGADGGVMRQTNTVAGQVYRIRSTVTPRTDAVTAVLVVEVYTMAGNATTGERVWLDNLIVESVAPGGDYFDGDTAPDAGMAYSWEGAARASRSLAMPLPVEGFRVRIDWEANGDFTAPVDDVTSDVRAVRSAVSLRYGREPGGDSSTVAGSGGLTLDNRDRKYSARNTTSPLYGLIRPGRPIQIDRTIGGTTYVLFHGQTGDAPLSPDVEGKTVAPELVDILGTLRGTSLSTAVHRGMRTGEVIGLILDAAGWTGGRDLDPGATVIPWWWEDGTDALTALDKIVRSEGFPALLTVGSTEGAVVFRDRHHRILRAASNTSQGVWRSSGSIQPVMARGATVDDGWANIVNRVALTVDTRAPAAEESVWQPEAPIVMARDTTVTIPFSTSDPFIDAYPSTGSWFDPLFPNRTMTLSRTSGTSGILTLTSGSADSSSYRLRYDESNLRILAKPLRVVSSTVVSADDAVSQGAYGLREWRGDLPWCGVEDAQSLVTRMVADRKDPLPVVTCRFLVGRDPVRAARLLSRDLSDRVTIVEPESVLSDDFHIESIEHTFSGEVDHEVQFTSEHVPPATGPLFLVGSSLLDGTDGLGW